MYDKIQRQIDSKNLLITVEHISMISTDLLQKYRDYYAELIQSAVVQTGSEIQGLLYRVNIQCSGVDRIRNTGTIIQS